MSDYLVKNKVIIVTGATKGMGLASSKQLLKLGAKVVMVYRSDTANARKVETDLVDYRKQMRLIQADITKAEDRLRIIDETQTAFNEINVLVNNAGTPAKASFLKEDEADFDSVMDVNLKAPIFLAKLVAEQMIKQEEGGSIINFSSVCGHRAMGGISYDAAKAGIIRASQTMANVLGKYGIRVNSISPGTHKTEMNRHHWENETERYKKMVSVTALRRAAEADEIAGTVVYLASDQLYNGYRYSCRWWLFKSLSWVINLPQYRKPSNTIAKNRLVTFLQKPRDCRRNKECDCFKGGGTLVYLNSG